MPIVIPREIPAFDILTKEAIFVMGEKRAVSQDIRPLEIAILNLMPTKIETETQLMRMLSNSPLQVNVTLIKTATYNATNVSQTHMERFYCVFDEIKDKRFDGLIVTGAPVEKLDFEDVKYWDELCRIFDYAERNVTSSVFICWGAQAALSYYYGIGKKDLPEKKFGVFENEIKVENDPLLRGLNDKFMMPHSRHTEVDRKALDEEGRLVVLAEGEDCGASVIKSIDNKKFFFIGHSEYDRDTLKKEYLRDLERGDKISAPKNYFVGEGTDEVNMSWRSTGTLLFSNWLNYYVYQVTPFDNK
ncbi:MAG: homoserine O-succinyltransferase [Clostridia bacterium]|nr:homoserine O-succinyltransferase [Clostridia bacterium]